MNAVGSSGFGCKLYPWEVVSKDGLAELREPCGVEGRIRIHGNVTELSGMQKLVLFKVI